MNGRHPLCGEPANHCTMAPRPAAKGALMHIAVSLGLALAVSVIFGVLVFTLAVRSARSLFGFISVCAAAVVFTCVAHIFFVAPGQAAWWSLPLGWGLCVLPNYIYSYHIAPRAGFFGRSFSFIAVNMLFILPPGVVSLVLALVHLFRAFHT